MPRRENVFNQFRASAVLITVLEGRLAFVGNIDPTHKLSVRIAFVISVVLVTPIILGGVSLSKLYVRLVRWVLQHLHTREEHRWVIALGITALCDVFLDTLKMDAFIVLSAISMIMICVVATGWDSDRSGMTEGLLIGFGKLLVVHMLNLDLLPSILCGAILILAITSKLTECTVGELAENPLHIGTNVSSSPTAQV